MEYNIIVKEEVGKFYPVCSEIPELSNLQFKSKEDLTENLYERFLEVLELSYRQQGRLIPLPKEPIEADPSLNLDVLTQAKVLFWNFLLTEEISLSDLAREADMYRQEVSRVLDFRKRIHMSKLEALAFSVGMVFHVSLENF